MKTPKTVTLITHITDGGAIYLMDSHDFKKATIIIRIDGGPMLIRFNGKNI